MSSKKRKYWLSSTIKTIQTIPCPFFFVRAVTCIHDSLRHWLTPVMSFFSVSFQQGFKGFQVPPERHNTAIPFQFNGKEYTLSHGSVVIAAITSCTNTSNPSVMLGAGGWAILLLPWILRSGSWSGWRLIGLYASSSRTPR